MCCFDPHNLIWYLLQALVQHNIAPIATQVSFYVFWYNNKLFILDYFILVGKKQFIGLFILLLLLFNFFQVIIIIIVFLNIDTMNFFKVSYIFN